MAGAAPESTVLVCISGRPTKPPLPVFCGCAFPLHSSSSSMPVINRKRSQTVHVFSMKDSVVYLDFTD
jgi:hypothetical protein